MINEYDRIRICGIADEIKHKDCISINESKYKLHRTL